MILESEEIKSIIQYVVPVLLGFIIHEMRSWRKDFRSLQDAVLRLQVEHCAYHPERSEEHRRKDDPKEDL